VPELPEVRAQAARLDERYRGAVLAGVDVLSFTALKTAAVDPLGAKGAPLESVTSRGKHLLLSFGDLTFVVHLMQGGRLESAKGTAKRPKGGLVRWRFGDDHPPLLLSEYGNERRAGVWVVAGDPYSQAPLDELGPEADAVSVAELGGLFGGQRSRLHTLLRDQRVIAGIGRRLANEICHAARLSPFAAAGRLEPEEIERVHAALQAAVARSLEFEAGQDHMVPSADRPAAVHHRTGEACEVCGDVVRAVEYGTYTVNYCATCQTGGKVLADNTTSKFLK
jgi:formamidopyrimidine-DNA glycosylase